MLNKKLMFSLVALLGFGLFLTLNGFKNTTPRLFQYKISSTADASVRNIANWEEVDGDTPSCGTTGNVVCRYEYDGDINAFQSYLNSLSTPHATLLQDALSTKE